MSKISRPTLPPLKKFIENNKLVIFTGILFIVLSFLRFYDLSADPPPWKRVGDIFDEGGWIVNSRSAVLFGQWTFDDQNKWVGSPLFAYLLFLSFKLFGVGFVSARMVSASMGLLTLILVYGVMLKTYGVRTACLSLLLLGFNEIFLIYNRLALVESTITFFTVLSFVFWYLGKQDKKFYFFCGMAIALSLLSKIFNLIYYAALAVIWFWEYRDDLWRKNFKEAFRPVLLALGGVFALAVPFYLLIYLPNIPNFRSDYDHYIYSAIKFSGLKGFIYVWSLGISQSFAEQIFTQPPATLMIVPIIIFVMVMLLRSGVDLGRIIGQLKPPIFYSLTFALVAWFVSLPFGFIDRRQVIFLIPWGILTSRIVYVLLFEDVSSFLKEKKKYFDTGQFWIIVGLLAYALWSTMHVLWRKFEIVTLEGVNKYLIFIILAAGIALLIGYLYFLYRSRPQTHARLFNWSAAIATVLFIMQPLLTGFKRVTEVLFGMGFLSELPDYGAVFRRLVIGSGILILVLLLIKALNLEKLLSRRSAVTYLSIYFIYNLCAIAMAIFMTTHTFYAESKRLGQLVPFGAIVEGSTSLQLAVENGFYPFAKHAVSDTSFNNDRGDAGYLIVGVPTPFVTEIEGHEKKELLKGGEKFITTIKLMPYPFRMDRYRVMLELYEVPDKKRNRIQTSHFQSRYQ